MNNKGLVLVFVGSALVLLSMRGSRPGWPAEPQQPRAYQPSSLKGLSDEELLAYMGKGKAVAARGWAERDQVTVPERFWEMSPREAALALLAATQAPEGKERYAVAIGKPLGGPPSKGTLVFSDYSDRSYNDRRSHFFLRFSSEGSFFAYAMTLAPGEVGYDVTRVGTAYDLRSCEVPYAEAKHFAQVIWWLGLAETQKKKEVASGSGMRFRSSSADGRGHLSLLPEDRGKAITESGVLRAMMGGTWAEEYDREAYLNLAGFAIEGILDERLSPEAPEAGAVRIKQHLAISRDSGDYAPDELARLKREILLFLKRYSPDGRRISHWHVLAAARAAGDLVVTEAASLLKAVQDNLPRPAPLEKRAGRTLEEIREEILKLTTKEATDESVEKLDKLMEEFERVEGRALGGQAIEKELNAAAATALRKIKAGDDVEALKEWAESRDAESTWAASRLRKISSPAYVDVLAARLGMARPDLRPDILQAIDRAAPQRALDIAAGVPASEVSELSTAAAAILGKAGLLSVDKDRIASLVKVVLDKRAESEQRNAAIDVLVPRDDPGRYSDKAVDDALIALVEAEPSPGFMPDFTQPAAARALAWRKRVDKLDSLIVLFEDGDRRRTGTARGHEAAPVIIVQDSIHKDVYLSSVTYLARLAGEAGTGRLARMIAPHLKRTNLQITEVIWSAWAADLRDLKGDIERIATASPADEEGPRASSSGGVATDVNERYHLARKIASLWSEEDLLTRGKLLLALGFKEAYEFVESDALERGEHMKESLLTLAREAAPTDLKALSEFIAWAEDKVVGQEKEPVYRERMEAFGRLAREILARATRKPMWSDRRSGSNRSRNAERQNIPSSVQAPPRRTRENVPSRFRAPLTEERSGSAPPGGRA
jgi:hypothetical protein